MNLKKRAQPYVENVGEATAACLITMVQGNVLVITAAHWLVAAETGLIAGSVAALALTIWKTGKLWMVSLVLGTVTTITDFLVHPGGFGPAYLEALVTGLGAAALAYVVGRLWRLLSKRRAVPEREAPTTP